MLPDGGIDPTMYRLLQTELTLDDALALDEIEQVQRSWHAASRRNEDRVGDEIARRKDRDR